MVRVARTWGEAAEWAGVAMNPETAHARLNDFPGLLAYQADQIGLSEYLSQLQAFTSVPSREQALSIHRAILMDEMPKTRELANNLRSQGLKTACLSNTNASHWDYLASMDHYPNIASLDYLCASHLYRVEKPDPEIYRLFEHETGFLPEEIVFFDDGQINVTAAEECGWNAFRIDPLGDTAEQMRTHLSKFSLAVA